MNYEYEIYNKINKVLEEKNVTVYEIADSLGFHTSTLYNLVNRSELSNTRLFYIVVIADYLNVEVDDLIEIRKKEV